MRKRIIERGTRKINSKIRRRKGGEEKERCE
jgi:hypothetical protein